MNAGVHGYRTLAQLGARAPIAAQQPTSRSEQPGPVPPVPIAAPRWTPPLRPEHRQEPAARGSGTAAIEDARAAARERRDRWLDPLAPRDLPERVRSLHEGGRQLWEFHPRDPDLRLTGRHLPDRPAAPAPAEDAGPPPADSDGGERSGAARTATMVGIGGGLAQNVVDVTRLVKKYPEALRAGHYEPALGRLGRLPTAVGLTALTRPDSRVIDPTAPRAASLASSGKSFTAFDELAMKSSVLLGAGLAGLQVASSIPNLYDALSRGEGAWYEDLALSTSGRAGVLQLAGGSLGLTLFATALRQTRGQGTSGLVQRIITAGRAPIMAKPLFGRIATGSALLVMANELGYLDFLNRGERRRAGTVLREAAQGTPVINDPQLRTAAILVGAGMVGYKGHRALQAAGGLAAGGVSAIGPARLAAGAVFAGLLGAQLLGALAPLDRP